jgi:threonine/homoserine/homoserine lactone efflux protein
VVLSLVLIGVAIALDPLPLMAFLVVLPSKRGVRKGAAFVFGWLVSLAIVVTITVLATGNNPPKPNTAPSLASRAVKIAIGVVLLVIAIRRRQGHGEQRSHGIHARLPLWRLLRFLGLGHPPAPPDRDHNQDYSDGDLHRS